MRRILMVFAPPITLLFSITALPALTSERALFVIDKKGTLRYIDVHETNLLQ